MFIRKEIAGKVATLTIDRVAALNALNHEVLLQLRDSFLNLPNEVRAVILTGAGEKAFVAGADIAAMAEMTPMQARTFVELGQGVMQIIETAPVITLAAVNGFALGGGLELALACDLIYAAKTAKLGLPETNLGIIPGFGGTLNLLDRAGLTRSMEMVLSGKNISAEDAKTYGIVADVFDAPELLPKVQEIAAKLAKKGTLSLLAAKRLIRSHQRAERERAYLLERETFATLFASGEPKEGMSAFLQKREAQF